MKNLMMKIIEKNDTVGIIICKQDNEYVIKYCSDDRILLENMNLCDIMDMKCDNKASLNYQNIIQKEGKQ